MDEIWVPTNFSRIIFEAAGVPSDKLQVVGEPVDTEEFTNLPEINRTVLVESMRMSKKDVQYYSPLKPIIALPEDTVVFLFVGKWETRKGIKLLLRAFYEEFAVDDNVALVLLTNAYHSSSDFEGQIKKYIKEELETDPSFAYAIASTASSSTSATLAADKTVEMLPKRIILANLPQRLLVTLYNIVNVLVSRTRPVCTYSRSVCTYRQLLRVYILYSIVVLYTDTLKQFISLYPIYIVVLVSPSTV
jgi:glycosyltransferase involved in cell wall biosynthesis